MSENEKDKEIKKMSEAESYDEYEGEAIEDVEEGPDSTEVSEVPVPLDVCDAVQSPMVSDSDQGLEEESFQESYEATREHILRDKWLSVTGKKPRNIPVVRKAVEGQEVVFFGDMRPTEVERNIQRRLLVVSQKIESRGLKFGKILHEVKLPAMFSGLLCVQFDPTAENVACCNRKGGVEVRRISTGEVLLNLKTVENADLLAVRYLKYFPYGSNRIYVVGQTGSIQIFNAETGELLSATEAHGCTYVMDISPGGNFLATGGQGGKVQVIDPYTLQVISKNVLPTIGESTQPTVYDEYHRLRIYGLRFHRTETTLFATGSWDNTVKIWDVRTNGAIRSINGPAVHGDGLDIRGNEILTATCRVENSLNLWDFNSGRLIKNIPIKCKSTRFEGEFLYVCRFLKDDPAYSEINSEKVVVGGSGFYNVIIIDSKTDTVERYFPSFKPVMSMDVHDNLLAYGGTESMIRIAEMEGRSQKKHLML